MNTLSVASAALMLLVAASLAPAIAQEPKLSDDNGPASHSVSTAARQMPSQQPRITSTNMVSTIMQGGEVIGSWSGNS
jgi:hypothetical protein